jgi:hypothetical protein
MNSGRSDQRRGGPMTPDIVVVHCQFCLEPRWRMTWAEIRRQEPISTHHYWWDAPRQTWARRCVRRSAVSGAFYSEDLPDVPLWLCEMMYAAFAALP